jgi:hypothetical protein
MVNIVPLSEDNIYPAGEFLMKEPYKNIQMLSLLENSMNGTLIYDNGVIKGILAVDNRNMELWFYGNRKSFKAIYPELNMNNYSLYIDNKNLDIVESKLKMNSMSIVVMRLKIRDYTREMGDARTIGIEEIERYKDAFGYKPVPENTFVKIRNGTITAGASVLSYNIKACAVGEIEYNKGYENDVSEVISSIVYKYRKITENMVIFMPYAETLKNNLEKEGFTYNGELMKLYKPGDD